MTTAVLIPLLFAASLPPATPGTALAADTLEFYSVHDSPAELSTIRELRAALSGLDLRDWVPSPVVRIDETQIPHSHPVLTIHTRHLGDADALLAVLLHEQFHWWVMDRQDSLAGTIEELRAVFPEVPTGGPEGARDESSTYLHLVVCHLERQAMERLKGAEVARATLLANTHYTWIYARVFDDPRVGEILARHGMTLQ